MPPITPPPTPVLPPPASSANANSIIPPLLFLIGQLLILAIGAARVELTARSGDLPQRLAMPEMIVFQLAISSLSFSTTLNPTVIVGSGVFLLLSGALTQTTAPSMCWTVAAMLLWLIALNQLSRIVTNASIRSIVTSIFPTAVLGLPIVHYLITEFSEVSVRWNDPISILIRQSGNDRPLAATMVLGIACTASVIFFSLHHRSRSRL